MRRDDDPSRLADHPGLDPWIVGLLHSTEPYKAQPGRKQRVLLSFGRPGPRRAPRLLRLAILAGVLIGCGAFASAAIGPWRGRQAWQAWLVRAYERVVPSPPAHGPAPVAEGARIHRPIAVQAAAIAPAAAPAPAVITAAAPSREPAALPRPHHAAPIAAPAVQGEQDTQAVLEGMRALRVDRDPVRARALLAGYLERHPSGALAEEALALSIEAAVAHHDPDAPALAAHYLRRYPAGPFSGLAREAQR
jgi:hypothetical protein